MFYIFQDRMISWLDEENLSDSDFSVMIENIPLHMGKSDIREIIDKAGISEDEIVYINMCYKFDGVLKLKSREELYFTRLK